MLKCQYSKICQKLIVAFNYDNCVVIKYPLKEHIPPQTTMEVKPSFLPARLMNNSESLCGMNKWFNNEHQQSSHIVALTSKWDEVDEEEGCYYTLGHRVCVRTPSVKPTHWLPSSGFPRNGCVLFLLLTLREKKKEPSLYDTEMLWTASTNKQLPEQHTYPDVTQPPSFLSSFCSARE